MSKKNQATAAASEEQTPKATPPLLDAKQLDALGGQEFGGQSEILVLEEGQAAGPFTYQTSMEITTDLGKALSHVAADNEGNQWRMPIAGSFRRCVEQANLQNGDTFIVQRHPDQIKKRGAGAGDPMAIFSLRVLERATQQG